MNALFLFGVGAERKWGLDRLVSGVDATIVRPFVDDGRQDRAHLLSVRDAPRNRAFWTRLRSGDTALVYHDRRFRYIAALERKFFSLELAAQVQPLVHADEHLFLAFRDVTPVDIELDAVNGALGYSSAFVPRGLFRSSDAVQGYLDDRYDGAAGLVEALRVGHAEPLEPVVREEMERLQPEFSDEVIARDIARIHGPPKLGDRSPERVQRAPLPRAIAHASIECPARVSPGRTFSIRIGLVADPRPDVVGFTRVDLAAISETGIDVSLAAPGFEILAGSARFSLMLGSGGSLPSVEVQARSSREFRGSGLIYALFSVGGRTIALAARNVLVGGRPDDAPPPPPPTPLPAGLAGPVPDLTASLLRGETPGSVLWTFESPHSLDLPGDAIAISLGEDPATFTRKLVAGIELRERRESADLVPYLIGVGRRVADKCPDVFWDLLSAVSAIADAEGRRASVLILSAEPHVPWELAVLDVPIDPDAPPFLAAQVTVGRWILIPRRPAEPPSTISGRTLVVVAGSYAKALEGAQAEVEALKARWSATELRPTLVDVLEYLAGSPPGELFHYAGHGQFAPDAEEDGLLLNDDEWLVADSVRGHTLPQAPLVFLNACQVGTTSDALGDHSGMAEAFAYAGAVGVVAPLWSVYDGDAKDLALRFYEEAFSGRPPAETLRDARAELGPDLTATTPLAFRFFGHPGLALTE